MTQSDDVSRYYDGFSRDVLRRDLEQLSPRLVAIQELIRRWVPEGSRVLEVGCGIGILTRFLQESRCAVHSVDISERNIDTARRFAPLATFELLDITGDVASLKSRAPFDRILLADVVEHLPEARRHDVLQSLEGLLAPDGLVLLSFPSPEYQECLRAKRPEALQIVDETVRLEELLRETTLRPLFFAYRDAWLEEQYVHLVLRKPRPFAERIVSASFLGSLGYRIANRLWRMKTRALRESFEQETR